MDFARVLRASRATGAGLASVGVFWGGFAAYLPDYKAAAGASDGEMGLVLVLSAAGGMAAMAVSPRVMATLGRAMLPVGGVLVAAAAFLPLLAGDIFSLGLVLLAMGAAMSTLDIAANVRISEREAREGLHLMNLNHALFSFAFGASAFGCGLARKAGLGPETVAPMLFIVLLALAVVMAERAAGAVPAAANGGEPAASPWAAIWPAAAILFAAFVSENATESWSALHIERTLGGPKGEGSFGPAMLGLTMGIGRLSGQFLAARLGEARLVAGSALLGMFGALVVAVAPAPGVAVLGVALIGLGVAVVVPSANSLLGRAVAPEQRAYAISRSWMLGFTGFFLGPVGMGLVAQTFGLRWSFVAVALAMAMILPGLAQLTRR
ncbi:MAG: MFS transporter [Phaeovulum sp.]|uniref:MFS transporter n=1 Tax=Phaeovulum sp. TaxID=2934796 RepID=UPI00272F95CD|nr:MFS transporter [Phaeovulum sp.]MDP2061954.1 MFS transporter [Phaeovulum sp.]